MCKLDINSVDFGCRGKVSVRDRTNRTDSSSNNSPGALMLQHRPRLVVAEIRMDRPRAVVDIRRPARRLGGACILPDLSNADLLLLLLCVIQASFYAVSKRYKEKNGAEHIGWFPRTIRHDLGLNGTEYRCSDWGIYFIH